MPWQFSKTSVERDHDKARMPNAKGMPNAKARKKGRQLVVHRFVFRGFGLLSSFVIRISVRASERLPLRFGEGRVLIVPPSVGWRCDGTWGSEAPRTRSRDGYVAQASGLRVLAASSRQFWYYLEDAPFSEASLQTGLAAGASRSKLGT